MKKSWMMLGSAVLSLYLAGCGGNDDTAMNDNNEGETIQTKQVRMRNVNNTNNNDNNGTLTVSDRAELQVEQMEEVDEAHVIISNNNAYVAVRLANNNNTAGNGTNNGDKNGTKGDNAGETASIKNNYSAVSNAFEQKIADQVRQVDKKVHKVYVSNNPDLYNRMNTFADDIRTNRNRDGLFEDFNDAVNDFFGR